MIETVVLFGHLVVAGLIITLVLLQRGKGADAGTGFGAGASGTVFGSQGSSSFFSRATAVLATLFFATSLTLAYFATRTSVSDNLLEGTVLEDTLGAESGQGARAVPGEEAGIETVDDDGLPDIGGGADDESSDFDDGLPEINPE